jgi:hypothetical protein
MKQWRCARINLSWKYWVKPDEQVEMSKQGATGIQQTLIEA